MVRIIFSGAVTARHFGGVGREGPNIADPGHLSKFDGLSYQQESMCDYLADGNDTIALAAIGLTEGHITLSYERDQKKLIVTTAYSAPRRLTEQEFESLKAYTLGQWSDGMGPNFSQDIADAQRVDIDFCVAPNNARAEQVDA